ncbi:MAG: hypothetical protein ACO3UU_15375, partial [Minisyncoccia bacterium]
QLHAIVRQAPAQQVYNGVIEKILFNRQKQLAKEYVLIDNDSFRVTIPLNFGACYVFAHGDGHKAHYCTSSSSGVTWFNSYKKSGLLIDILDKNKLESKNGKWQIHANSGQIKNATQDWRVLSDDDHIYMMPVLYFKKYYPNLISEIIQRMNANKDELQNLLNQNYGSDIKVGAEIEKLHNLFNQQQTNQ